MNNLNNDVFNENIAKAAKVLKDGGTMLYPTDTIWGLGCDATNEKAVEKIYKIKKRPPEKSPIILLDDELKLFEYVANIPPIAIDLINSVNNPVSIIYPHAKNLPKNVIAKDGSIAIRIVRHKFCKQLIGLINKPIVSTSANISGEPAPTFFNDISKEIINAVDFLVSREMEESIEVRPSTVVKFNDDGEFEIIRS
ncbi:MAG: L-threonylcarbamoyladenylate synthase [Bacteroidales bacterium]|jgi:L-threonylcarbamoyladenylate synthase|nr:L-threonylcarbamoyladenylate synthase [Bacteroidales bacterium]MDD2205281.1 L-threonylcarbamoyladenylate synthase [Bacteroidales bacterium]MDD3151269.1 L-threonylcarbamoyladenylate synthase [Bacteroidales bacterium]MDD3914248.1 L-threonylcarbamoyladenylate synthase [Bacteroidales bacterium]MDD4633436.1 L-threonylcarbamoyladenylate synthase [Bacteroidales bacterium]